jgi:hypothetical protein
MYKIPHTADYKKAEIDDKGFTYGDDLLGVLQTVVDTLGQKLSAKLVPALVNKLFPMAFKSTESTVATIGETFCNTKFKGKVASAAIGIDSANASKVMETVLSINKKNPFPGGIAMRYVKGTKAMLGFTRFPKTCIIELDGVDSKLSRAFFSKIWACLEELSIPYTLHWGKINFNLTPALVNKMYGEATVKKWKTCRNSLLNEKTRSVFTNVFMIKCGLAD